MVNHSWIIYYQVQVMFSQFFFSILYYFVLIVVCCGCIDSVHVKMDESPLQNKCNYGLPEGEREPEAKP